MSGPNRSIEDALLEHFRDPAKAASYPDGPQRFVPGLDALHVMMRLLLSERVTEQGEILVLGAGGGSEISHLAQARHGWRFVGVDPAEPMLRLAETEIGPDMDRVQLIEGYVDDAPEGPFDAAVCLLTLHFLAREERVRTVGEIHRRLRPGAPFVAAHISFPQASARREAWLDRYAAYPVAMGLDPDMAVGARAMVSAGLQVLDPDADEDVLRAAGFADPELFYAAMAWRGWVATA